MNRRLTQVRQISQIERNPCNLFNQCESAVQRFLNRRLMQIGQISQIERNP
ncbi:Uncharacterized protein dnm_004780 [Desulfonema magnum]|uniref:Uncharacterized protein n=1 Tax=Desulfonema magnum TaxID=45655 RepID=A0A975BFH9_9BACT|nr:Uncharacterized protein dnm_004780 [Desulfonema magnum]